jgi:hypothetical protein
VRTYSNQRQAVSTAHRGRYSSLGMSSARAIRRTSRLRIATFVVTGLVLLALVVTKTLAAYLADTSPSAATWFQPTNATALLNLADEKINAHAELNTFEPIDAPLVKQEVSNAKGLQSTPATAEVSEDNSPVVSPAEAKEIRTLAKRAVLNDPLNARAFRILGQLSQNFSNVAKAALFMQASAGRSLFETVAVYWVMRQSYQDGDYRPAIRYGEALLRTRPQNWELGLPLFGKIAETSEGSGELKHRLAANPQWRSQFFSSLSEYISDARTPLDILLALKDTPNPPTAAELKPYVQFLVAHEFYDLAYYTWLQFLPPEQLSRVGNLFNGSFEMAPSGSPFDWTLTAGSAVTAEVANRADQAAGHGLFIEFGAGRVDDLKISQLLVLPPGGYEFDASYKANIVSQRGLKWRVVCANKTSTVLGESPTVIGAEASWKDIKFSFAVPDGDCPAQSLDLRSDARSASEQFVSGSVWFDDLQITRTRSQTG